MFAPERALAKVWQHSPRMRIVRVDIETTRRPDLIVDIQKLPLSPDEIDFVWCHHVLEHVEDDGAAMKELNRILRPATGELIVSVPMNGLAQTTENGFPDPKDCGHWRIYGHDFVDKLKVSGFEVREVDFDVTEEQAAKFAIVADAPFYICRKPVSAST